LSISFSVVKKKPDGGLRVIKKDRGSGLRKMRFNGPLCPHPIQFPDDVSYIGGKLRGLGLDVSPKDCQALGHALSVDYYPFSTRPEQAWLVCGTLLGLVDDHAMKYLCDG